MQYAFEFPNPALLEPRRKLRATVAQQSWNKLLALRARDDHAIYVCDAYKRSSRLFSESLMMRSIIPCR